MASHWFAEHQACAVELDGFQSGRLDPPEGQSRPEAIQVCVERMVRLAGKLQRLDLSASDSRRGPPPVRPSALPGEAMSAPGYRARGVEP